MRSRKDSSDISIIFAIIGIGLSVVGIVLPVSVVHSYQSGFIDVFLQNGNTGAPATITFNPTFSKIPTVSLTVLPRGSFGSQIGYETSFLINPSGQSIVVSTTLAQVGTMSALNYFLFPIPFSIDLYLDIGTVSTANTVQIFIQSFDCTASPYPGAWENMSFDGTPIITFDNADTNSLLLTYQRYGYSYTFNSTLWNIEINNGCTGGSSTAPGLMPFRLMMKTISGTNTVTLRKIALLSVYDVPAMSAVITSVTNTQVQIEVNTPSLIASQTVRIYWTATT